MKVNSDKRSMGVSPMSPTGILPVVRLEGGLAASSSFGRAETALRRMGGTPMPRGEAA